jgi:type I restriction enzyme, S subunit
LGEVVKKVFVAARFKRIYVEKEYGVPFLQGSHLPQMKPYNLKYLSKTNQRNLERWIIQKNWVLVTCSGTIGRIGLTSSRLDGWAASQHIMRIVSSDGKAHPGYITAFLMTPYGQHQLTSKIYGAVVDELTAEDAETVWLPDAPKDIQAKIGELVVSAYEKRDEANILEEVAIQRVESALIQSLRHEQLGTNPNVAGVL